jgi:hypothetical protein
MSFPDLLADYAELEPFAAVVKRNPRTVVRWMNEPNGLPFAKIGNRRLIHIPTARAWLLSRVRKPNPRRGEVSTKKKPEHEVA